MADWKNPAAPLQEIQGFSLQKDFLIPLDVFSFEEIVESGHNIERGERKREQVSRWALVFTSGNLP